MKKLTKLLALLAVLALFAAACGDDDETTDAASDSTSDSAPAEEEDEMADGEMAEEEQHDDEDHDHDDEDHEHDDEDAADDDMADEGVTVDAVRIVSLSPTATEMLFAIGVGPLVVGVDQFSNYPAETADVENTGLDGFTINVEAIAALEPTHIFMQSNEAAEAFRTLGIEVVENDAAATFDDVYTQIEQMGAVTGNVGEAAELVLQMQTDIDGLLGSLPDVTGQTFYHELTPDYYSATSSTFIGEVYGLFGLVNIADEADPDGFGFPQLSEEYIVDSDPNFIFLADTICCAENADTVGARPGWEGLQAVIGGNVVELNDDIVSRWGPRVVDFIAVIAGAIESATVDA